MLRISRKHLLVLVAVLAIVPVSAQWSRANPVETKEKKPEDRQRSGKRGKHSHGDKEKQGGSRRSDDIPSFRSVKRLESLTPVQEAKITHIIRQQKEQLLPLTERLREIRAEVNSPDFVASGSPKRSPESIKIRRQIHAIKKDAWLQMQKVLTTRQKIELEAHRDDESGPPRRNNPNARPAVRDSGRSFSQ